jgi:probable selenium-dependent hydroxylase accessory protein YqeC
MAGRPRRGGAVSGAALLEALGAAAGGLVCLVGAGGKKSTIYQLANAFSGRLGITATAHIEPFPKTYASDAVVTEAADIVGPVCRAAATVRRLAFARPCPNPGRLLGVSFDELAAIRAHAGFELLLVKADGARGRILKAPARHEPALPPDATTVIAVASARALGAPLDARIAHRPERVAAVCGLAEGEPFEPRHLARLLSSREGALQGVGDARVVPLINMVDDEALAAAARDAAREALTLTDRYAYVVLASMRRPQPIVEIVRRQQPDAPR